MPTLISKYKKHETSTRLKKFYSMMTQALMMSENDNGPMSDWGKSPIILDDKGNVDINANGDEMYKYVKKYIAPYIKYTALEKGYQRIDENNKEVSQNTNIKLADGTVIQFWNGDNIDILVDTNGNKKPNVNGIDIFLFNLVRDKNLLRGKYFGTYLENETPTREIALEKCKEISAYCSSLLMFDNWEFKDDYPYNF